MNKKTKSKCHLLQFVITGLKQSAKIYITDNKDNKYISLYLIFPINSTVCHMIRDTACSTRLHVRPAKTDQNHRCPRGLCSDCVDVQADLSLCWARIQSLRKGCTPAHVHDTKCAYPDLTVPRTCACALYHCLTLSTLGTIFSRQHIGMFFLFFPGKVLKFHANCLHYIFEPEMYLGHESPAKIQISKSVQNLHWALSLDTQ